MQRDNSTDMPAVTAVAVRVAARHLGFEIDDRELAGFTRAVEAKRGAYLRVRDRAVNHPPAASVGARVARAPGRDDPFNAWVTMTYISGSSSGPLAGWTVAIKDTIGVAGIPLHAGSRFFGEVVPVEDASVVSRLLDAGAEITGIARCEDLGFSGHSFTSLGGPVRNPYDPERSTGGSSSGCAALVAAGDVDLAIGGDQGGSVTGPASWSGICGLKPSFGAVPYTGALPGEPSVDHLGPMARTVMQVAAALEAIAGRDGIDPRQRVSRSYASGEITEVLRRVDDHPASESVLSGVRVGVLAEGFAWPDLSLPAVDDAVRTAAQRFALLGATVQEVSLAQHRDARDLFAPIISEGTLALQDPTGALGWEGLAEDWPDLRASLAGAWAERADELPVPAKVALLTGLLARDSTGGAVAAHARSLVADLTAAYARLLERVDVLVMPTQPGLAGRFPGAMGADEFVAFALGMSVNTCATNLTGNPALSVPCGTIDGLPVGMLIVGRLGEDAAVLRVGHAFQSRVFRMPPPPQRSDAIAAQTLTSSAGSR